MRIRGGACASDHPAANPSVTSAGRWCMMGSTPSSVMSARTRRSMSSRIGRMSSISFPAGSSSSDCACGCEPSADERSAAERAAEDVIRRAEDPSAVELVLVEAQLARLPARFRLTWTLGETLGDTGDHSGNAGHQRPLTLHHLPPCKRQVSGSSPLFVSKKSPARTLFQRPRTSRRRSRRSV